MLCFLAGVKSELAHGTPSEINTYISMNNCTKFGALIRSVTVQPLSNPTKRLNDGGDTVTEVAQVSDRSYSFAYQCKNHRAVFSTCTSYENVSTNTGSN